MFRFYDGFIYRVASLSRYLPIDFKIFEITKEFSKVYQYTIGQDMKNDEFWLMQSVCSANKHSALGWGHFAS